LLRLPIARISINTKHTSKYPDRMQTGYVSKFCLALP
jgi:hypothetical protein